MRQSPTYQACQYVGAWVRRAVLDIRAERVNLGNCQSTCCSGRTLVQHRCHTTHHLASQELGLVLKAEQRKSVRFEGHNNKTPRITPLGSILLISRWSLSLPKYVRWACQKLVKLWNLYAADIGHFNHLQRSMLRNAFS